MTRFDVLGFAVFLATAALVSYFAYGGTVEGSIAIVSEGIGSMLPVALLLYLARRGRRFWYGALFLIGSVVLALSNQDKIAAYFQMRDFQKELLAGGEANFHATLAHSQTPLGKMFGDSERVTSATDASVNQMFAQLNNQPLQELFTEREKLKDRAFLSTVHDTAAANLEQVQRILPETDKLLNDEAEKIRAIVSMLPPSERNIALGGISQSRKSERVFVQRRVDNEKLLYETVSGITEILLGMGELQFNEAGSIAIQDQATLDKFTQLNALIPKISQEDQQITADYAAFEANRQHKAWQAMTSQ